MKKTETLKIEQPKLLTDIVLDRLRQAIIEGQFQFGENISEIKMAEALGVSRTPVRDALFQLQMQGLVSVLPKRGSFVFEPTEEDVIAICEFRYMLEVYAIELSIKHNLSELLNKLGSILEIMKKALSSKNDREYGRADSQFHQSFFDFCNNCYIQDSYKLAEGRIAVLRTVLTTNDKNRIEISFKEHLEIVDSIKQRDLTALKQIFHRHIDRTLTVHLEVLRSRSLGKEKPKII